MISRLIAVLLLIFILPIMLIIGLLLALTVGFPVIFVQKRVGKDGKQFVFYKFRTMVKGADREKIRWKRENIELWQQYQQGNFKLKDDHRVTKIGKFLRKTSLDELPQIFNIIKGEMNFIGPRPILHREKKEYGRSFKSYTSVKPGITCLWQINGRSDTSFKDRVMYDRMYSMKKAFKLDFFIFLKTVIVVLTGKGSY